MFGFNSCHCLYADLILGGNGCKGSLYFGGCRSVFQTCVCEKRFFFPLSVARSYKTCFGGGSLLCCNGLHIANSVNVIVWCVAIV
jgi:hypothetical protein